MQLLFVLCLAAGIEIDGQIESDTESEGNVEIKKCGLVWNTGGDTFYFSLWLVTCSTTGTISWATCKQVDFSLEVCLIIAICKPPFLSSLSPFIHAPRVGGCRSPCALAVIPGKPGIAGKHHPVQGWDCFVLHWGPACPPCTACLDHNTLVSWLIVTTRR